MLYNLCSGKSHLIRLYEFSTKHIWKLISSKSKQNQRSGSPELLNFFYEMSNAILEFDHRRVTVMMGKAFNEFCINHWLDFFAIQYKWGWIYILYTLMIENNLSG